jgi:hypothetical protein
MITMFNVLSQCLGKPTITGIAATGAPMSARDFHGQLCQVLLANPDSASAIVDRLASELPAWFSPNMPRVAAVNAAKAHVYLAMVRRDLGRPLPTPPAPAGGAAPVTRAERRRQLRARARGHIDEARQADADQLAEIKAEQRRDWARSWTNMPDPAKIRGRY